MRIAFGLAVAAAVWASPAFATNWYLVATTEDKAVGVLVDRDSISDIGGNVKRAVATQILAKDNANGAAALQALLEFDCTGSRYRFISLTSYTVAGAKLKDSIGSGLWRPVVSTAVIGAQLQFVCTSGTEPEEAISFGGGLPIEKARAWLLEQDPAA